MQVEPWSGVKEQTVDNLSAAYKDFLSLRGLVSDTDGNLTVETFCKASAAISKYAGSKCVLAVHDFVTQSHLTELLYCLS